MAETSSQPVQPQQQVFMAPGQQTGYQPPPGQPAVPAQQVVYAQAQAPVNKPQRPPIRLTLDFSFLCTQVGVFKLIEFVEIILALSCLMHYKELRSLPDGTSMADNSDVSFFSGSLISGWVMVILVTFGFIIGLHNVCGTPQTYHLTVSLLHALWALLLVISSSLMASQAADWMKVLSGRKFSGLPKEVRIRLILLFVAVAFGFLAFISLVMNAMLHSRIYSALKNQGLALQAHQPVMQPHPGMHQPVMQPHPGMQQPMMQPHPGMQQPMMQPHPGMQQPMMQPHPGMQQPVMQAHPGMQ